MVGAIRLGCEFANTLLVITNRTCFEPDWIWSELESEHFSIDNQVFREDTHLLGRQAV